MSTGYQEIDSDDTDCQVFRDWYNNCNCFQDCLGTLPERIITFVRESVGPCTFGLIGCLLCTENVPTKCDTWLSDICVAPKYIQSYYSYKMTEVDKHYQKKHCCDTIMTCLVCLIATPTKTCIRVAEDTVCAPVCFCAPCSCCLKHCWSREKTYILIDTPRETYQDPKQGLMT